MKYLKTLNSSHSRTPKKIKYQTGAENFGLQYKKYTVINFENKIKEIIIKLKPEANRDWNRI